MVTKSADELTIEDLLDDFQEELYQFYRDQAVVDSRAMMYELETEDRRNWRELRLEVAMKAEFDCIIDRMRRGEAVPYFKYEALAISHARYQSFKALRVIIPT